MLRKSRFYLMGLPFLIGCTPQGAISGEIPKGENPVIKTGLMVTVKDNTTGIALDVNSTEATSSHTGIGITIN